MLPTLVMLQCLAPGSEQGAWVGITAHSEVSRGGSLVPGSLGPYIGLCTCVPTPPGTGSSLN